MGGSQSVMCVRPSLMLNTILSVTSVLRAAWQKRGFARDETEARMGDGPSTHARPSALRLATGDSVINFELVEEYRANALFSAYQDDLRFGYWLLVDEPKMPRGMRERNARIGNNALNAKNTCISAKEEKCLVLSTKYTLCRLTSVIGSI